MRVSLGRGKGKERRTISVNDCATALNLGLRTERGSRISRFDSGVTLRSFFPSAVMFLKVMRRLTFVPSIDSGGCSRSRSCRVLVNRPLEVRLDYCTPKIREEKRRTKAKERKKNENKKQGEKLTIFTPNNPTKPLIPTPRSLVGSGQQERFLFRRRDYWCWVF